jgi:succinate-acetate transporter protein
MNDPRNTAMNPNGPGYDPRMTSQPDPRLRGDSPGYGPPAHAPGYGAAGAHGVPTSTTTTTRTETRMHGRTLEDLAIAEDADAWRARSRIVLTPMAAPSVIGLTGFAIATLMVGAWQAGWYGTAGTPAVLWPLALVAGGIMQSIAAFMALRARDAVAGCVHTAWGAFWIGWGTLQIMVATGVATAIPIGATNPSFAFWWIALAIFTISAALATLGQSLMNFIVLAPLAAGAAFTAAGFFAGSTWPLRVGGWLFVIAAAAAWLAVTAMMLENAYGRTIIPMGRWAAAANVPGRMHTRPIAYEGGMPGVRVGQ